MLKLGFCRECEVWKPIEAMLYGNKQRVFMWEFGCEWWEEVHGMWRSRSRILLGRSASFSAWLVRCVLCITTQSKAALKAFNSFYRPHTLTLPIIFHKTFHSFNHHRLSCSFQIIFPILPLSLLYIFCFYIHPSLSLLHMESNTVKEEVAVQFRHLIWQTPNEL